VEKGGVTERIPEDEVLRKEERSIADEGRRRVWPERGFEKKCIMSNRQWGRRCSAGEERMARGANLSYSR